MRTRTKYPGITLLGGSPGDYEIGADGSVMVPHGRPVEGQPLEESNYYELTEGKSMNDIMRTIGLPEGEVLMGPEAYKSPAYDKPKKKRVRRSTKKDDIVPPDPAPKACIVWDIPGIGSIKSEYSGVYVGESCVCLYVDSGDNAFIPNDYRDNSSAVYIMKYRGSSYRVIYSGLNFKVDKVTAYVLLGGYNDGQEE